MEILHNRFPEHLISMDTSLLFLLFQFSFFSLASFIYYYDSKKNDMILSTVCLHVATQHQVGFSFFLFYVFFGICACKKLSSNTMTA